MPFGARHILADIAGATAALGQSQGRPYYLIAESDLNDGRVIRPPHQGGYGLDAQWADDFHHALHALLTDEQRGYYRDFGTIGDLATAWRQSFVYDWRYSQFRQRYHGSDVRDRPGSQFVVCAQNHDQIGNQPLGERLSQLTTFAGLKLAAANVLLAQAIPLLFMGEEYGEESPFLFFTSHGDPDLVAAVRAGRQEEFAMFHTEGELPEANSRETFQHCVLNWEQRHGGHHGVLWEFYRALIDLRRSRPALHNFDRQTLTVQHDESERWLWVYRQSAGDAVLIWMNWHREAIALPEPWPGASGLWQKQLDSAATRWQGPGATLPNHITWPSATDAVLSMPPMSVAVYHHVPQ